MSTTNLNLGYDTCRVKVMRGTGKWRFKGEDAERVAAALGAVIGVTPYLSTNDAEMWVVDPRKRTDDACPGCGSVSTFVGSAWETVHEDDCSWFHGLDPIEADSSRESDKSGERRSLRESGPAPATEPLDRDGMRRTALFAQRQHDPAFQKNGYDRCEHCHYTRHPCDVYDLATMVLALLDEGRDGRMESDAD